MSGLMDFFGENPGIFLGVLVFASLVSLAALVVMLICLSRMNRLFHTYDRFMRGRDAESLEESILAMSDELKGFRDMNEVHTAQLEEIRKLVGRAYVRTAMLRYDGFKGMGGQASFVLTMLDREDNGFILNSLHSRDNEYLYLKEVKQGQVEQVLSDEEKKCLNDAMGGHKF